MCFCPNSDCFFRVTFNLNLILKKNHHPLRINYAEYCLVLEASGMSALRPGSINTQFSITLSESSSYTFLKFITLKSSDKQFIINLAYLITITSLIWLLVREGGFGGFPPSPRREKGGWGSPPNTRNSSFTIYEKWYRGGGCPLPSKRSRAVRPEPPSLLYCLGDYNLFLSTNNSNHFSVPQTLTGKVIRVE